MLDRPESLWYNRFRTTPAPEVTRAKEVNMKITLKMEKATKNTIRFEEVLENELDAPKIGSIYIPKATLAELGWKEDKTLTIEMEVK